MILMVPNTYVIKELQFKIMELGHGPSDQDPRQRYFLISAPRTSNQRSASGTRVPGIPRPGPGFSGPGLGPGQTFSCGRGTRDGTRDWKLKKTGPGTGRGTKNWKKNGTRDGTRDRLFFTPGQAVPSVPVVPYYKCDYFLQMWLFVTNMTIYHWQISFTPIIA